MKKNVLQLGLFSMILLMGISCKNKEKELSDKRISELESFVDSLKMVSAADREANWDKISEDFDTKTANANLSLTNLDETAKTTSQEKINVSSSKYNELKVEVEKPEPEPVKVVLVTKPNPNQLLRDRLFGAGKIGEDMIFA